VPKDNARLTGAYLTEKVQLFRHELEIHKQNIKFIKWYEYDTLSNFQHIRSFLDNSPLDELASDNSRILDIGGADGDLAFFLETLGFEASIIDFAPTNQNQLEGAETLAQILMSKVDIHNVDLDSYSAMKELQLGLYGVTFFLGLHYHLKNPFLLLDFLSSKSKYVFFSTRIARFTPRSYEMKKESLAYLLDDTELNNDPTNFWVFSESALIRLFHRTNFEIVYSKSVGDKKKSTPDSMRHDERFFALLKSRVIKE
jgi:tRNA (mo5U34)-methyltransferase